MNEISFTKPVNNSDTDIDNMSLIDKMSIVCKYVASNCFKESNDLGGSTYTFTVDEIWDKETGVSMGSVTINWKLGE